MLTQWLQPIPERTFIRVVYVGEMRLVPKFGTEVENEKPTLEKTIDEIWKVASVFNRENYISGHLSCSKTGDVVQCLEGREKTILSLMSRIMKDPRVVIHKVFQSYQLSMNQGWALSMCYSFEITSSQMEIIQNDDLTIEDVFGMMKNTHQAIREKLFLPDFYKEIMQTILLKFIAVKSKNIKNAAVAGEQDCGRKHLIQA